MNKNIALILGILLSLTTSAEEFAVGQIWDYQTRAHESGAQLTVVKIDQLQGEDIIHISLSGLQIKNPHAPSGVGKEVSHIPISPEALRASVTKLNGQTTQLPDFQAGYDQWRAAFDAGQGGYFTISVAECVEYIEQAMNQ